VRSVNDPVQWIRRLCCPLTKLDWVARSLRLPAGKGKYDDPGSQSSSWIWDKWPAIPSIASAAVHVCD